MRKFLAKLQAYMHKHHRAWHRCHEVTHLGYFACVALHGPYQIPALGLGAMLIIGWILHLETEA